MNTPGSPAETYRLSDIDNINLITGRVSFAIPLADIPGRGAARTTLVAHLETYWKVAAAPYPYNCGSHGCSFGTSFIVTGAPWYPDDPDYVSGVMQMRGSGDYCGTIEYGAQYPTWENALTRLTYIAPDGTETEFRDNETGGLKEPGYPTGGNPTYNRGTVFSAYDASSSVFTTNMSLSDPSGCNNPQGGIPLPPSGQDGTLQLRDGTAYTFTYDYLTKIEDRNGNLLTIDRSALPVINVHDSYGRTTTISEGATQDTISYPGAGGAQRTVTIAKGNLSSLLYTPPGQPTVTTLPTQGTGGLFSFVPCGYGVYAACSTTGYDSGGYISQITLPNSQFYQFKYNPYGDVAKLILPTGGRYEYDYQTAVSTGGSGGSQAWAIQRQVTQKRIYLSSSSTTPDQVITYTYGATTGVTYADGAGNFLSSEVHTGALPGAVFFDGTQYNPWMWGKETEVDYHDSVANGGGLLKTMTYAYQQRDCSTGPPCWFTQPPYDYPVNSLLAPLHDPRTMSQTTAINGQVSEQDYGYDSSNNRTLVQEYDFGTGAKGTLLRTTNSAYQPVGNMLDFLKSVQVVDNQNGGGQIANTIYSPDLSAVESYSSILQHDSTAVNYGNVTTVQRWLYDPINNPGGTSLSSYYYYDIAGNVITSVDPRGVQHDYGYSDSLGTYALPTSVKSYTGLTSTQTLGSTPPAGTGTTLTASVTYDYNIGKPTQTTDVNNNSTSYSYGTDTLDRLVEITRPVDHGTTTFTYTDTPGSVSVETVTDQAAVSDGNLKNMVFYDGLGRDWETSKRAASQNIMVCKTYDGRGRLQSVSNPAYSGVGFGGSDTTICGNNATSYVYDGLNRPTAVTAPDASVTSYKYQADSASHTNQTLEIEPGPVGQKPNRLQYADAAGRLKEVDENVTSWQSGTYGFSGPATVQTTYNYDALDDLTLVCQNGTISAGVCSQPAHSRSFTYDSIKRLVRAVDPESGTVTYVYDASGNLSKRTDANASVLNSAYDGINRVTGKSYILGAGVASTPSVTYAYGDAQPAGCNLKGGLMSVTAGSMVNNYCYQWAGKPSSSSQATNGQTYAMSYAYDLALEPTTFTFPGPDGTGSAGRQQTTQYDTGGRVSNAGATYNALPTTYGNAFGYFPDGMLANVTLGPSAQVQQYCQNNRPQVVGVRLGQAGGGTTGNCASSGDLLNLTMTYGSAGANDGNLTGETIVTPLNISQTFTYDAYNRVAKATEGTAPAWSQTYNYDAYGNRWVTSPVGFPLYSFTPTASANYDSNNRLAPAFHSSAYDLAGDQTGIGGYAFTYNAEGRQYTSAVNATTTYTYDGEGRRVMKTTGSAQTVYVYDATGQVAAEYSTAAPPQVGTLYLTLDHLGSTRLETNDLGAAVAYHDYLPFGEEIPSGLGGRGSLYGAVDGLTHKFTGKERDAETASSAMQGLDYFGARYFSGAQGRFTSPDPLLNAGRPDNPQTWNKYAYTLNNPLKYTDPTGLYEWSQKCGDDDAQCQANRQQFRDALATIRNAANQYEEGSDERNKLEAVLDKYGDEGEKNKASIKFGEAGGFPAQESTSLFGKKTITFDMKMLGDSFRNSNSINPDYKPSIGWGEVVAHEGAHMLDRFAFGNPVNRTGALRTETNAFDTQSFVPKATNQYSFWGLWNPSWVAADKETLRQNAVKDQAQKDVDLNWGKKK